MSHIVMFDGEHAAARRFLKDCADAYAQEWDLTEETNEFIDSMNGDQLRAAIHRTWGAWEDWRAEFAADIAAQAAVEQAQWLAEFDAAARRRLYGSHMRAVRFWTSCTATGPEAVREIGDRVIESRNCHESWAEIGRRLGVRPHVLVVWSVETRARRAAAVLARPFRTTKKES
ncbi:hypothetical protein [Nocardia mangyaensis]|uniref:hypothetical protein n=1 Tax=Nocardia mangyaensis TaxID=2213200 RepID=UPI002676A691|nr:hypothetical protein [Nocardia mangyaensis]MDO3648665.1 hypothetical protein [Nocardia mangyaensis]